MKGSDKIFSLQNTPIPLASIAFSLTVLGDLWRPESLLLHNFCGLAGAILFLPFALRCLLYPRSIFYELDNDSATAGLFPKLFMTSMQLAAYLAPYAYQVAFYWYLSAVIGHFLFIIWFTYQYIYHLRWQNVFASWFIVYVGIVVASTTAPVFALQQLGLAIFYFGLYTYLATLVLISWRYYRYPVQKIALQPLFCIYTAPLSLCLAGYLQSAAVKDSVLLVSMTIFSQIIFCLVLSQMVRFLRQPFALSIAAYTFPFVITALAFIGACHYLQLNHYWQFLASCEKYLASTLIVYVIIQYVRYRQVVFCHEEARSR